MTFNLKALRERALSAFILAPLFVLIVIYGSWPFSLLLLGCAALAFYEWVRLTRNFPLKILFYLAGLSYLALSFWSFYTIREAGSIALTILFVVMVWSSDSGAYFLGKLIGGPKMAEKISPNKTWAGFSGATLFPALAGLAWIAVLGIQGQIDLAFSGLLSAFLVGGLIGCVGQGGDLLISFMKRKAGVKDTGDLIPGHGGLLDRIDAMMLASPVFLLFVSVFS